MDLCLLQMIFTAAFAIGFLIAVIYMLTVNRCKFNKRTKVVIIVMTVTMCLAITSSTLIFIHKLHIGTCSLHPLPYAIQLQNHVIVMIIYSFLVCRMLSIYHKMSLAVAPVPSCKARLARRVSQCQNPIVITYLASYSAIIWTFYFFTALDMPKDMLTSR